MTQEDKDLLLKDLCARLPYGVKCACSNNFNGEFDITSPLSTSHIDMIIGGTHPVKPYLRPMSSMTKEEEYELNNYIAASMFASQNKSPLFQLTYEALYGDFFNRYHFDYRGLIPMGLALEAPKDMYGKI